MKKMTIDCGHGPSNIWPKQLDPGAVSGKLREYIIAWNFGETGRAYLTANYEVQILMTRPKLDSPKYIMDRQPESEKWGAEYYLSLHLNANEKPQANGVETFWADTKDIPFARLVQDSAMQALDLAQRVGKRADMPGLKYQNESPRGRLVVLDGNVAKAALLELGFITNPHDVSRIQEKARQIEFWERLATGLKLQKKK